MRIGNHPRILVGRGMCGLLLLEIRELGANRCSIVAPGVVKLLRQTKRASLRPLALSAKLPTSSSLPDGLPPSGPSLNRTCSRLREPKNFAGELDSSPRISCAAAAAFCG